MKMVQRGFRSAIAFDDLVFSSKKAAQALKKMAERLRQMTIEIDKQPVEHTLVEKEPWEQMEISREEVTWLNKELPEWSKEYDKDYTRR